MAEPGGGASMRRPSRLALAAAIVCVAAAVALWRERPQAENAKAASPVIVVDAAPGQPGPAVERIPAAASPATLTWLTGTWSRRDNGGRRDASCDLASATTYLPEGQFIGNQVNGRFATDGRSVTVWGKVSYDIDAGEDRSRFDERTTLPLHRLGDHAVQIGGERLFRCERRAPDQTSS